MMGANWQSNRQHSYEKKFAWRPVRSNSGKFIWLKNYHIRFTYYDHNGKPPIKDPHWAYVYTRHEFLLAQLKGA